MPYQNESIKCVATFDEQSFDSIVNNGHSNQSDPAHEYDKQQ